MKKYFLLLILLTGLFGCNVPTQFLVPESSKEADKFSKIFINHLINGQEDSCLSMYSPEELNDKSKTYLSNAIRNINQGNLLTIKFLECNPSFTKSISLSGNRAFAIHRFAYEYQFERGYVLFKTIVQEKDGKLSLTSFDGQFLKAPISELTKFTLEGKSFKYYLILIFMTLVPLFILATLVVMLASKIRMKKKWLWFFIILFLNVTSFWINWSTGETGISPTNLNFNGGFFASRGGYSPWILGFSIPLGAILFWFQRKSLLSIKLQTSNISQETNRIVNPNETDLNKK
jgi:hypothetical protein